MRQLAFPFLLLSCASVPLEDPNEALLCDACEGTCSLDSEEPTSAQHIDGGLDYAEPPPFGGDHDPCWAPWGVHVDEVADENWVHNLEHGGVVILHNCDGCPEIDEIEQWSETLPAGTVLVSPYAALSTQFAAVSWGRRLLTDCADTSALQAFYDSFVDQAPESVTAEPSSSCTE